MRFGNINFGNPVNQASPLNRGLLSWWLPLPNNKGGGTLFDLCARNNGTLTNMDPATDWVPRQETGLLALDLDGGDDEIVASASGLNFASSDSSLVMWVLPVSSGSASTESIFITADGTTQGPRLLYDSTTTFIVSPSNSNTATDYSWVADTWQHVAISMTSAGTLTVWLNGQPATAVSTTSVTRRVDATTIFGRRAGGTFASFQVSDTRLYSRLLTENEPQQLYLDSLIGYRETLQRKVRRGRPTAPAAPAGTNHHFLPLLGAA